MKASTPAIQIPPRLGNVALLGRMLQQLDTRAGGASAEQYRALVLRLQRELADVPDDHDVHAALARLLDALPALAEVYENLHYAHAGLCRTPLDVAAPAELGARDALARAAAR